MARRRRWVLAGLVALGSAATSPLSAQVALSPQASISTLRHEWNTAFTMRDTARMGRLVTDSTVFISDRVELRGRESVTTTFGKLFASKPDIRLLFTIDTIFPARPVVTDMVASEYGTWQETWFDFGGTVILRGTYYDVWRREAAGWRIAVHTFAVTSCSGNVTYCNRY